jgi:hypothetical protein
METHRLDIALNPMERPPIAVRTPRSSQTERWGLEIKKNFSPPPAVKFVLDIPFHRTLSPRTGEGENFGCVQTLGSVSLHPGLSLLRPFRGLF